MGVWSWQVQPDCAVPLAPDAAGRLPPDDAELEAGAGGEDGDGGGIGGDEYGEEDAAELEELLPPDAAKSGGPSGLDLRSQQWRAVSSEGAHINSNKYSPTVNCHALRSQWPNDRLPVLTVHV